MAGSLSALFIISFAADTGIGCAATHFSVVTSSYVIQTCLRKVPDAADPSSPICVRIPQTSTSYKRMAQSTRVWQDFMSHDACASVLQRNA